jgi:CDGSH-type Zn-finger protein
VLASAFSAGAFLAATISTIDDLRTHLQWAIALEHATIPPYLCALYSFRPGRNQVATEAIASVFLEEMLHMTLAANVLNAVGGAPVLDAPDFMPRYPAYLPHSADAFLVPLARFSRATIETFMKIEKPEMENAPAETDRFHTIGQFYRAIEDALPRLCHELGEKTVFSGDPARQVTPAHLPYRGSGRIIAVYDLQSALAAIDEIEEQGEGLKHDEVWDGDRDMFHPERDEVAHYFRYHELIVGRAYRRGDTPSSGPTGAAFETDWDAVYPMRENPRAEDFAEDSPVRAKMHAFNVVYSDVLRALHHAFNGHPADIFASISGMMDLKTLAVELMQMPTGDGATSAGPSFEYVPRAAASAAHPETMIITVRKDGPYVVEGGVPLSRKSIVYSEWHEPMTWRKDEDFQRRPSYRLCRCGRSAHKPFCDNTHARAAFDGTEDPPAGTSAERREVAVTEHITVSDDRVLCTRAGFCGNRVTNVWKQLEDVDDSRVRFDMIQRIERCPSGRLAYEVANVSVEPDLPKAIAVTKDGPYAVTGGITVTLSDGRVLETRNRVMLCRCGESSSKPLCDGTHFAIKFREG